MLGVFRKSPPVNDLVAETTARQLAAAWSEYRAIVAQLAATKPIDPDRLASLATTLKRESVQRDVDAVLRCRVLEKACEGHAKEAARLAGLEKAAQERYAEAREQLPKLRWAAHEASWALTNHEHKRVDRDMHVALHPDLLA